MPEATSRLGELPTCENCGERIRRRGGNIWVHVENMSMYCGVDRTAQPKSQQATPQPRDEIR